MTSTSVTSLPATIASTAMTTLSSAISAVGIDSSTAMAFIGSASSTGMALKDGAMGLANAYKSVSSFTQWMRGGEPVSSQSLASLAHGLNAAALLDKAGGKLLGLGGYTNMASAVMNVSNIVSGVQSGNLTQVAFSGAKLCVCVALAGNPAAGFAVTAAEMLYNRLAPAQGA
jgi:hypothetical protein